MTAHRNRIEKRPKPFVLDEDGIKAAYLRGETPGMIAHQAKVKDHHTAIHEFIRENRDAWDEERARIAILDKGNKLVIERQVIAGKSGGLAWVKISLPRIAMHVAALGASA